MAEQHVLNKIVEYIDATLSDIDYKSQAYPLILQNAIGNIKSICIGALEASKEQPQPNSIQKQVGHLINVMDKINKDNEFPAEVRLAANDAEIGLRRFEIALVQYMLSVNDR